MANKSFISCGESIFPPLSLSSSPSPVAIWKQKNAADRINAQLICTRMHDKRFSHHCMYPFQSVVHKRQAEISVNLAQRKIGNMEIREHSNCRALAPTAGMPLCILCTIRKGRQWCGNPTTMLRLYREIRRRLVFFLLFLFIMSY